jgi:hypothetical protein
MRPLLLFLFIFLSAASAAQDPARKVAVTFDDLPTVNLADTSEAGRPEDAPWGTGDAGLHKRAYAAPRASLLVGSV